MVGLLLALPHKRKISMTRCLIIESLVPHVQLERLPVQSMVTMKHHPSNPHSLRFAAEKTLAKPWPSSQSRETILCLWSICGRQNCGVHRAVLWLFFVTSWPSGAELWRFHNPHGELEHGPFSSLNYPWKMVIFRYVSVPEGNPLMNSVWLFQASNIWGFWLINDGWSLGILNLNRMGDYESMNWESLSQPVS